MKKRKGFTIIEMVIVVGLISIITMLVTNMLSTSLKNYRIKKQVVEIEEKGATVLREFEQSTRAATKIEIAQTNELSFYRYFDLTSPSPSKVRYFMDGNQFKVGITKPSGIEPDVIYPIQDETVELIVPDVINASGLFKYYNGGGDEISGEVDPSAVRMVQLTISLDKNGSAPPNPITDITKVTLRNMKDNL